MPDPFSPKFVDLVRNFTSSTGTGNMALGAAPAGFTSFASAVQAGERFYYSIQGIDKPAEREVGRGTMLANGTISREPISGAATNFTSGQKTISLIAAAEWFTQVGAAAVGGSAAAPQKAASRGALAGLAASASPVVLTESGREGLFVFQSGDLAARVAADPQQGIFIAPANAPSGASGAWVRQVNGSLDPRWFGMVAGDSSPSVKAANANALSGLLAFLNATDVEGCAHKVEVTERFHVASPNAHFSVKSTVYFHGTGSGRKQPRSGFVFDRGGFQVERYNTLGLAAEAVSTGRGDGSTFRGLYLASVQARPSAATYAADATCGIRSFARVIIEDCWIEDFTRDGIALESGPVVPGVADGNANNCIIRNNTSMKNGRHGIYFEGVDANAGTCENNSVDFNNNWGIYDSSFLGNHHSGHHAMYNGVPGVSSKHDGLTSVVTHAGSRWYVAPGEAAAASTTAPGTNSNVWCQQVEFAGGAAPGTQAPAWASGTTYKEGGSYRYDGIGSLKWVNCYAEVDQGQMHVGTAGMVEGGVWERHPTSGGSWFTATGGDPRYLGPLRVTGDFSAERMVRIGRSSGAAADFVHEVLNTNFFTQFNFKSYYQGVESLDGRIQTYRGYGLNLWGWPTIDFQAAGAGVAIINQNGFNLVAGKVLQLDGVTAIDGSRNGSFGNVTAAGNVTGANLSGTNTGDQTIALTGDVTGSGTGSFAATIGANKVTFAKLQAASAAGFVAASAAGNFAEVAPAAARTILGLAPIATSGSGADLGNGTVSYAKLQTVAAARLIGNAGGSAAAASEIGLAGGLAFSGGNLGLGAITPTSVSSTGAIRSSAGNAGVGYATGAGGSVVQATSKSTGVTLDKVCGQITTHNASLAAGALVEFTVTNSQVTAADTINLNLASGAAASSAYRYWVSAAAGGSFKIAVENRSAGALSEALVFSFAVLKSVAA